MNRRTLRRAFPLLLSSLALGWAGLSPVAAHTDSGAVLPGGDTSAQPDSVVVLQQGLVTRQDIPTQPPSEEDTVVEPDVAVSPVNDKIAIAVAHDSRYSDGGAVDITVAWTADGGASWHHKAVQGITKAAGGTWDRASDPVVAFGPDGTAYMSVLAISLGCPSGVVVLRSTDGGQHWSKPVSAHESDSCAYSDDKNWIVVDNSKDSKYYGRVYQFWTPFISNGSRSGSPQAVRWSDDGGKTWSSTSYVTPKTHDTQNSQPMILPDGSIVDTYYEYPNGEVPGNPAMRPESPRLQLRMRSDEPVDAIGTIYAATSHDGGKTWSKGVEVANNAGGYAKGVRCCLFAADIDSVTHLMYTAWEGGIGSTDPVYESFSSDGTTWSSPVRVSRGDKPGVQRVNVDVVARGGNVYVAYGTRTKPRSDGGFVQQQVSVSTDRGHRFGPPTSIGPRSVLKYAAQSRGYFPGDYIGEAISPHRIYMVWAMSSKPPPRSDSPYHQVIYGATMRSSSV